LNLVRLSKNCHTNSEVQGTAYGLMWPRTNNGPQADILILTPGEMICGYETSSQWPVWAIRRFVDGSNIQIWAMSMHGWTSIISDNDGRDWAIYDEYTKWPTDFVQTDSPPVVEFGPEPGRLVSGIKSILGPQQRIDRLTDTDASLVELASAPSTYILISDNQEGIEKGETPKVGPGVIQQLEAESITQLSPAPHDGTVDRLEQAMHTALTLGKIPLSVMIGAGGNMSGEAITRDSASLLVRCQERIHTFSISWKRLLTYAALWTNKSPDDIVINWCDPNLTTEMDRFDLAARQQSAGVTRERALLNAGVAAEDIQEQATTNTEE